MSEQTQPATPEKVDGRKRRSKYTPERVARIMKAISKGATYKLACLYGGITEETFNQWRRNKPEFSEELMRVEADAALLWLDYIEKGAMQDWRAAAWKIERRYPEEYGRRNLEVSGKDGGPIKHQHTHKHFDLSRFSPDELADLDALAARYDETEAEREEEPATR